MVLKKIIYLTYFMRINAENFYELEASITITVRFYVQFQIHLIEVPIQTTNSKYCLIHTLRYTYYCINSVRI